MPYIRIQTNQAVDDRPGLLKRLSSAGAAAIGKPEAYVQTALDDGRAMTFAGSDAPTAFVECKSIGLEDSRTSEISAVLCGFCRDELGVPEDRVYIEFTGAIGSMWGWRGGTL